jgi:hypothetical protein
MRAELDRIVAGIAVELGCIITSECRAAVRNRASVRYSSIGGPCEETTRDARHWSVALAPLHADLKYTTHMEIKKTAAPAQPMNPMIGSWAMR